MNAGAQQAPGASVISSVTVGDGSLVVVWTAPASDGGSAVTAYDLRYIASSASDKDDADWTVIDDVWSSGSLQYKLTGLIGAVSYDVQVRAVNTADDGAWSATVAGTPRVGTPVISAVTAGDAALTVAWSAPTGVSEADITAYDLRHIASSAADKGAAHWTVVDDARTSGKLQYVLAGLTNATGYDVQVRAVTESDGAWSATAAGTPAEHGDTHSSATSVTSGVALGGRMQSATDADYFKIELTAAADVYVHTSGALDTHGEILNSSQTSITANDDGGRVVDDGNFFIATTQPAGVYYIKVTGNDGATGSYALHVKAVSDTTGTADAETIHVDDPAHGMIQK